MGISYWDHVRNEDVLRHGGTRRLEDIVTERRMRLAGHILRLPDQRIPKTAMPWVPPNGKWKQGRPLSTWRSIFKTDLSPIQIPWEEADTVAADRTRWRTFVAQCAERRRWIYAKLS